MLRVRLRITELLILGVSTYSLSTNARVLDGDDYRDYIAN